MKSDEILYCSRCGEEISVNSRYCMKCGNINYNHPENQGMKKFEKKNDNHIYEVGQGDTIKTRTAKDMITIPTHTGNQKKAYLLNYLVYIGFILIYALITYIKFDFSYFGFLDSSFTIGVVVFSIIFLYVSSLEIIFMKTNNPWWSALIPIYNIGVFSKITLGKAILGFLYLVPVLNILLFFYSMGKLGKRFGYNSKLTAILFFIMIPVIAYRTNSFDGKIYLDIAEKNIVEKDYKRRNRLFLLILFFIIVCSVLYAVNDYDKLKAKSEEVAAENYVYTAEKILGKVKDKVSEGEYSCSTNAKFSPGRNYYFHSVEAYYEYGITNLKSLFGNEVETLIYVNIDSSGNATYYMSMSDGEKGFNKILESELQADKVVEYKEVVMTEVQSNNYVSCSINSK